MIFGILVLSFNHHLKVLWALTSIKLNSFDAEQSFNNKVNKSNLHFRLKVDWLLCRWLHSWEESSSLSLSSVWTNSRRWRRDNCSHDSQSADHGWWRGVCWSWLQDVGIDDDYWFYHIPQPIISTVWPTVIQTQYHSHKLLLTAVGSIPFTLQFWQSKCTKEGKDWISLLLNQISDIVVAWSDQWVTNASNYN